MGKNQKRIVKKSQGKNVKYANDINDESNAKGRLEETNHKDDSQLRKEILTSNLSSIDLLFSKGIDLEKANIGTKSKKRKLDYPSTTEKRIKKPEDGIDSYYNVKSQEKDTSQPSGESTSAHVEEEIVHLTKKSK